MGVMKTVIQINKVPNESEPQLRRRLARWIAQKLESDPFLAEEVEALQGIVPAAPSDEFVEL